MPRDLLINIINKGLYAYVELAAITITTMLSWFIVFQLGYKILGVKISSIKTLGPILIMTLNSLFGKQIFPFWLYGIELLGLIAILLKVPSRVSALKSIWTGIVIIISSFVSDFFIVSPLVLHPQVRVFLFKTALGYSILNLIEALVPAIFLLILTHFPLPILPPFQERFKKRNAIRVTSLILTFYLAWCAIMRLLDSILNNPKNIPSSIFSEGIAAIGAVFVITFNYVDIKKEFDEEQQHHEKLQQQNELKIQKLEEQNQKLSQLIEELHSAKVTPQELDETINNAIARLQKAQEANQALIIQLNPPMTPPDEDSQTRKVYLSPREITVLELVGQGKTNPGIAEELKLKESYIRATVSRLYDKLEIHDRGGLAVYAIKTGYTKLGPQ